VKTTRGQAIDPDHTLTQLRQLCGERLLLSLPQLGTAFEDQVALRQGIEAL